ncbi:IQ domain-containing protein IQM4-like [Euphorbia lathyris]|uniref:IQ domain-containing protein IQM4-like n=1 Tax=Euphorbia lathyris TaxID=212925 RepID=UPI0033136A2E
MVRNTPPENEKATGEWWKSGFEDEEHAFSIAVRPVLRKRRSGRARFSAALRRASDFDEKMKYKFPEAQTNWKALDFVALKRSSVSFFNIQRHETAASKWARATTRAAKVGKGLSKDEKAQKLALQHWLEAIDPRHRYGHNLHFYYDIWCESKTTQPFFYWLDVGEGKEINLEKCPRNVLNRQIMDYLGPKEREAYEVIVENGKLVYRESGSVVNSSEGSKWIFVLSTKRSLYIGQKKKGAFQHSSFLSKGATVAAGRLVAHQVILKAIWPYRISAYHKIKQRVCVCRDLV